MRKYLSYAITATTLRRATAAVLILLLLHEVKSAHMQGVVSSRPSETCHPGGVSRDLTGRSAIISSKLRSILNSWGGCLSDWRIENNNRVLLKITLWKGAQWELMDGQ